MLVANLKNGNGRPVVNQYKVETDGKAYFQSYGSTCARVETKMVGYEKVKSDYTNKMVEKPIFKKVLTFGRDWDYSKTTLKWLRVWMDEYYPKYASLSKKELQKLIEKGEIGFDMSL